MIRQQQYTHRNPKETLELIDKISSSPEYKTAKSVLLRGFSSRIPFEHAAYGCKLIKEKLPKAQHFGFAVNNREQLFSENIGVVQVQYFEHTDVRTFEFDCEEHSYEEVALQACSILDEIDDIKAIEVVSSCPRHGFYKFIYSISKNREDVIIFGCEAGLIQNDADCPFKNFSELYQETLDSNTKKTEQKEYIDVVSGLETVFKINSKIAASEIDPHSNTYVIGTNEILRKGIVIVVYASKTLKVHPEYLFGWKAVGKELTITSMRENDCVETIDDLPATDVYHKYLNVQIDENMLRNISEFPLVTIRNGFEVARLPPVFDKEKRLYYSSDVYLGEKFRFSFANSEQIITQAKEKAEKMHEFNPEILSCYVCGNHILFLGENYPKEIEPFKEYMPDVLSLMGMSEIFRYNNQGGVLNSMLVTVGMREDELDENVCYIRKRKTLGLLAKDNEENKSKVTPLSDRLSHFLSVITNELSDAVDDAKKANEAKSQFLSNMSHEIRTPINTILGMNELILRENSSRNIAEYAENIRQAGNSLLSLINDILDFSKIEAGKFNLIDNEYLLESCLSEIYALLSYRAKNKNLNFIFDIDQNIPAVLLGDDLRVKQILTNILTNAIKYTDKGTVVLKIKEIHREHDESTLFFSVKDTGIGIKQEDLPKLTAAFERIDESRNKTIEGTGLGMSITVKLLKMMGSKLEVQSTFGVGSEFSFYLKQKIINEKPIGNFNAKGHVPTQHKYHQSFTAPDAKILVVDDTQMNLTVIVGLLKNTQISIETAQCGVEAIELFRNNDYDLILLDHRMPGMDGIETLAKLKAEKKFKDKSVPVIALTANAIAGARQMYLEAGFDDYLTKPVDPRLLEKTLVRYLDKTKIQLQDTITEINEAKNDEGEIEKLLPQSLINNPDIDCCKGIENCGSVYNYLEALKIFSDSVIAGSNELEEFVNKKDYTNFTIKVHALKSSARVIGAVELSEKAKRLEDAGNKGYYNEIDDEYQALLSLYRSFDRSLAELKSSKNEEYVKKGALSENDLTEAMENLKIAIDEYDFDTLNMVIEMLKEYKLKESLEDFINRIQKAASIPDWQMLHQLLKEYNHG